MMNMVDFLKNLRQSNKEITVRAMQILQPEYDLINEMCNAADRHVFRVHTQHPKGMDHVNWKTGDVVLKYQKVQVLGMGAIQITDMVEKFVGNDQVVNYQNSYKREEMEDPAGKSVIYKWPYVLQDEDVLDVLDLVIRQMPEMIRMPQHMLNYLKMFYGHTGLDDEDENQFHMHREFVRVEKDEHTDEEKVHQGNVGVDLSFEGAVEVTIQDNGMGYQLRVDLDLIQWVEKMRYVEKILKDISDDMQHVLQNVNNRL